DDTISVHAETHQAAARIRLGCCRAARVPEGQHGLAGLVHSWKDAARICRWRGSRRSAEVRRSPAIEVAEHTHARGVRKNGAGNTRTLVAHALVPEGKEERFAFDDRATVTDGVFVLVEPISSGVGAVLQPCPGVQGTVTNVPHRASAESVRSRPRRDVDLRISSAQL